jgi:putative effector of murein hydrolase
MELGRVEGAVAGVVMIVAGLGVLVATPLLARLL